MPATSGVTFDVTDIVLIYITVCMTPPAMLFIVPLSDTMSAVTTDFAVFNAHNSSNSDCNLCSFSMYLLKTACKNSVSNPS